MSDDRYENRHTLRNILIGAAIGGTAIYIGGRIKRGTRRRDDEEEDDRDDDDVVYDYEDY